MFIAGWAILVAALVHIDWHFGRPQSMRLSMDWDSHWLLGLGAGVWLSHSFARRLGSGRGGLALVATGLLGFILRQIVQPGLEAITSRVTFATANPPVRWSIFVAFSVAWLSVPW